jgi:hypothetical protein
MTLRPDYGALLHSRELSSKVLSYFYDVPIKYVSVTDAPCLSTTLVTVEAGIEYALSFDFTDESGAHLLARCRPDVIAALEELTHSEDMSVRTVKIDPPVVVTLAAKLGPLQESATEVFAPLLVQSVE